MQNHIVDSQATVSPHWISHKGFDMECSKCGSIYNRRQTRLRDSHERECWVHHEEPIMKLSLSDAYSFDYSSFDSISVSSESSSFELMDNTPSLSMDCSSVSFDSNSEEDIPSPVTEEVTNCYEFEVTTEECASFECKHEQICNNPRTGIKPYDEECKTTSAEEAVEFIQKHDYEDGQHIFKDYPTGKYVKASFCTDVRDDETADYAIKRIKGVIYHIFSINGIDTSNIRFITGGIENTQDKSKSSAYVILPDYCVENGKWSRFVYHHTVSEYGVSGLVGFVPAGTPIIPLNVRKMINDTIDDSDMDVKSVARLTIESFIRRNIDRLKNIGEYFTIRDMKNDGTMDMYKRICPHDDKNQTLGDILKEWCGKPKRGHSSLAADVRSRYYLKPECIAAFI